MKQINSAKNPTNQKKLKLTIAAAMVTGLLVVSNGLPAEAYWTVGPTWSSPSAARYLVILDSSFSASEETVIKAANIAYDASKTNAFNPSDPGSSTLNVSGVTITTSTSVLNSSSFRLTRYKTSWPWDSSYPAITCRYSCTETSSDARSNVASINLNDRDFTFTTYFSGSSIVDLQTVVLHELGHAHGLAHPQDFRSVISQAEYASVMTPTWTIKRSLTNDDILGLESIY